ncbi:MAG: hypothetical protein P8184_19960, partial [Calditrichia bacterium]
IKKEKIKSLSFLKKLFWHGVYETTKIEKKIISLDFKVYNNFKMDQIFDYPWLDKEILLDQANLKIYQDSVFENYLDGMVEADSIQEPDSILDYRQKMTKRYLAYKREFLSTNHFRKLKELYELEHMKSGPILKSRIIKEGKLENKCIILFESSKYDDFAWGETGYWFALSSDQGNTWKEYYTGLTENHFYFIRKKSNLNIWKNDSLIQCHAAIVRRMGPFAHPGPGPEYELIEHVILTLNINKIITDSDDDGLTDIEEAKMLLNPLDPDSDNDGIIDSKDSNPRYKSIGSDDTFIYETILERNISHIDTTKFFFSDHNYNESERDSTLKNTYLIVTDNHKIQTINPKKNRYIIMTSKEFDSYKRKFPVSFFGISISPLFKCDDYNNIYKINFQFGTGGEEFVIIKQPDFFKIFINGVWIS